MKAPEWPVKNTIHFNVVYVLVACEYSRLTSGGFFGRVRVRELGPRSLCCTRPTWRLPRPSTRVVLQGILAPKCRRLMQPVNAYSSPLAFFLLL